MNISQSPITPTKLEWCYEMADYHKFHSNLKSLEIQNSFLTACLWNNEVPYKFVWKYRLEKSQLSLRILRTTKEKKYV